MLSQHESLATIFLSRVQLTIMIVILIIHVKEEVSAFRERWRSGRVWSRGNASCPVEPSFPVPGAHVLDADWRAGLGGVDETVVTEVNPHVGERPLGVVEN
jgi:hypothetical protein